MDRPRASGRADPDDLERFQRQDNSLDKPQRSSPSRPDTQDDIFPIRLNRRWRVVFDKRQWVLQKKHDARRWDDKSFCVSRDGLLTCIIRRCGPVNPDALVPDRRRAR
jgi:hypothetical protein